MLAKGIPPLTIITNIAEAVLNNTKVPTPLAPNIFARTRTVRDRLNVLPNRVATVLDTFFLKDEFTFTYYSQMIIPNKTLKKRFLWNVLTGSFLLEFAVLLI